MKHWFRKYTLRMVTESSALYECGRRIQAARDVHEICRTVLKMHEMSEEHLVVLYLDTKNNVTGIGLVSHGTLNAALIHPREIYKGALLANCNAIILAHNHPSGDVTPSNADVSVTAIIRQVGTLLQIELLDHVIIGLDGSFHSFRESAGATGW
ncbi:MAG: JAB domain-containing protein [Chlorobiaceae bacterium]